MRKVLLVCLDNMGDLVFTSALAMSLSQDPDIALALWCKDYTARMGHLLPGVRQVFASDPFWDKSPGRGKGSLRLFLRTLRSIRRQKFAIALVPSTCWRTALFLRLAGIPLRVGIGSRKNKLFLSHVVPPPDRKEPVVAALLRNFASWLPQSVPPQTRLESSRLPQLELPKILQNKSLVCLHAFAGRRDRCAPLELLKSLAHSLEDRGFYIIWLGSPAELRQLRLNHPSVLPEHCADQWAQDLLSVIGLISRAQIFIGHDSGPLHVAGALGIPVLGFYLPGEPKRTLPQGRAWAVMVARDNPSELHMETAAAALDRLLLLIQTGDSEAVVENL